MSLILSNTGVHPKDWVSSHITPTQADGVTHTGAGASLEFTGTPGTFKFIENDGSITIAEGETMVYSAFVKFVDLVWFRFLFLAVGGGSNFHQYINAQTMTFGTRDGPNPAEIVDQEQTLTKWAEGSDWYLYTLRVKVIRSGGIVFRRLLYFADADNTSAANTVFGQKILVSDVINGVAKAGSLNSNDAVRAFLIANGYNSDYNDGLRAWLKNLFSLYSHQNASLNDLLRRYNRIHKVGYSI